MSFFTNSFRIWFRHFGLFAAITFVVWIPGNGFVAAITSLVDQDLADSLMLRLPMLVETLLGPLSTAAILFVADRSVRGEQVSFGKAMQFGMSNWGKLFGTRFVANFMMGFGFLLLLIPGIVMLVRFAFLDQAVIIDGLANSDARERSWRTVPKVVWRLILVSVLYFLGLILLSIAAYTPLEILIENDVITLPMYYVGDVFVSCIVDVAHVPFMIALYFLYREAKGEEALPSPVVSDHDEVDHTMELPPDDGNPYNAPLT